MDNVSVSPPPTAATPEDVTRLLDAARAALKYLDDLDRHGPIDLPRLGGEGRLRRRLRDAIRAASYEVRDCPDCDGGTVGASASPTERPTPATCPGCEGSGRVRVFAYERPKARRR